MLNANLRYNYPMNPEIKWTAPEFQYYPKTTTWYYWSIFITLLLLGFAVWQKNFLFGFFIVIAETLILSWGGKKPSNINFLLNEKGLTIDGQKSYSYSELKSFAKTEMDADGSQYIEVMLYFKKSLRTTALLLVPKEKYPEVSAALSKRIPKIEAELTILDALERIIRF